MSKVNHQNKVTIKFSNHELLKIWKSGGKKIKGCIYLKVQIHIDAAFISYSISSDSNIVKLPADHW